MVWKDLLWDYNIIISHFTMADCTDLMFEKTYGSNCQGYKS